jgi:hypothetical protein
MLQFHNQTPFEGKIFATPDQTGVDSIYAVVKATFTIGARIDIAEKQAPVSMKEEYLGEPGKSSVRAPSDFALAKPGTDVVMTGSAYSSAGTVARYVDVRLSIGSMSKIVRVFGDRVWERTAMGYSPTEPAPFERMPLFWERAYGGNDISGGLPVADSRNPVGAGFFADHGAKPISGSPLPNLEDPYQSINAPGDRPVPAGFGPICGHWQPRRSYAGTYDAAWQANRAPYLPADFDARFFQVAPPDLISPAYLNGGEPVEIVGVHPNGPLRFYLPLLNLHFKFRVEQEAQTRPGVLDLVWFDTDNLQLAMTWRAGLALDKRIRRVREVEAALG